MVLDAVCTNMTSLPASRYSAVKFTTGSYQLKPASNFVIAEKCKNMVMRLQSPLVYM